MVKDISNLRMNYAKNKLLEGSVSSDPIVQFRKWMDEAISSEIVEPNAMNLATVNAHGRPSSRIVLLKEITDAGFIFYTNYESRKAEELAANPLAALNFLWKEVERQVRIEGQVEKISREKSEQYFHSRPYGSQIGAVSSHQSNAVDSREVLENRYAQNFAEYEAKGQAPMPSHWGGYLLTPDYFEFWQGRESRLHDRLEYKLEEGEWIISRLEP